MGRIVESGPWQGFEVISEYGDAQALEDGELVDISGRLDPDSDRLVRGARATRAVYATLCELSRKYQPNIPADEVAADAVMDCQLLYRAVMRHAPDEDGWRKSDGRNAGENLGELWLIPNEVGGLTLMFPSDY